MKFLDLTTEISQETEKHGKYKPEVDDASLFRRLRSENICSLFSCFKCKNCNFSINQ